MNVISRRQQFTAPAADIRVIHSSDIHVSEGFTEPVHEGDGTAGLRVVLAAARASKAHVVILAGDTFEHNRLSPELLERTLQLLGEAGMPVVILPGNHDPAIADSVYHRGGTAALPHVHVLGVTHDAAVLFPPLGLEIWGHAHRDYHDMDPLLRPHPRRSFWQIAVAHGHYEPKPNRATHLRPSWLIGDDDIDATGADYVALGHWNRYARVGSGKVEAYYSGSPDHAGTVNLVRLKSSGEVVVTREAVAWDKA
jgi:DNA repair exonuclease SbcCD nuclease subunit